MLENKDIKELTNKVDTKTKNLFLLSFITLGIYPFLWIYKYTPIIESITNRKICSEKYIIWFVILIGFNFTFSDVHFNIEAVILMLPSIIGSIMVIMWAFKARSALQAYALSEFNLKLKMNPFYTFILTFYHINYCINSLPSDLEKEKSSIPLKQA